jgi:diguanylate cyclase (GGDEF)-like protein
MTSKKIRSYVSLKSASVVMALILFSTITVFVYWAQTEALSHEKRVGVENHTKVVNGLVRKAVVSYLSQIISPMANDISFAADKPKEGIAFLKSFDNIPLIKDSAILSKGIVYQDDRKSKSKLTANFSYSNATTKSSIIYTEQNSFHYIQSINDGSSYLYLIIDKTGVDRVLDDRAYLSSIDQVSSKGVDINLVGIVFFVGVVFVLFMLFDLRRIMVFIVDRYEGLSLRGQDNLKEPTSMRQYVKDSVAIIDKRIIDLTNAAFKDSLTKLGNLNALKRDVDVLENKSQREPLTVFHIRLLDVLSFRDQYGGNAMRNLVVKGVATIKKRLDKYKSGPYNVDVSMYRVCDDEVSLLVNTKDRSVIEEIIADIKDCLTTKIKIESISSSVEMSVAIGVSIYPSHDKDLRKILQSAELSVQKATSSLNERVVFYNELPQSHYKEKNIRSIDTIIQTTLQNNGFYLYYQPVFRHENGEGILVGFEALLRSDAEILKEFKISEIIDAAEHGDIIAMIGKFVIREACEQFKLWKDTNVISSNTFMSINISTYQFYHDSLESLVSQVISEYELAPGNLRLEFKPELYHSHNKTLQSSIKEVRAQGVKVILDDFDIDFSSKALKNELAVDGLKINRKWLLDAKEKGSNELIKSIVSIGHYMNAKVGITGVEDDEDIIELVGIGCEEIQGYALCVPTSAQKLTSMLPSMKQI